MFGGYRNLVKNVSYTFFSLLSSVPNTAPGIAYELKKTQYLHMYRRKMMKEHLLFAKATSGKTSEAKSTC